jgi:hypothetical protein
MEKWGEKKDNRYLLVTLSDTKRNESETIKEFNKIFNQIVETIHADIKPLEAYILIYYVDAFEGELDFHLRQKYH